VNLGFGLGLSRRRAVASTIAGTVYGITIGAGEVSADLTDFPVMIDLADMPSAFWTGVRSDGGNVRAYAADGVTQIPIDLTYINVSRQLGRMFVKSSLLAASDNVLIIKLASLATTALAVTDPYGRNAVWADYEVVWVFPSDTNRTGKSHTQTMGNLLAHSEWIRTGYNQLSGTPHNGICTDGTHFISTDDIVLRRMNMSYAVQQTVSNINTALSAMTGLSNFDHMGDPVCVGTSTFFTVTTNDATYRRFLVEYRTSDLTLLNAWEMTGAQRIYGATVCYDGTNLLIFSFDDDDKFIKYTTSGSYVSDVSITGRPGGMNDYQGSTVLPSGNILISGGTNGIYEITPAGAFVQQIYTDPHSGIMEGLEYYNGSLFLLKGNGAMITLRDDVHQDYRKLHGGDTAYSNMTAATTWTASASVYWTTGDFQQAFMGVDDSGGTASSGYANAFYDEGPDNLSTYNSTNTNLYLSPTFRPVAYDTFRLSFAHNGTSGRKIRAQKGSNSYSASSGSSAARPSGSAMDFVLNANQRNGDGGGEAYYQFAYLRLAYLSDAWLAAEHSMLSNPSGFYTIT